MNQAKIGRFLKQLRNEKAITQEKLAEKLGVSNRSISRWENGTTMPDFDLLIELAKYYDVEMEELLNGERKGERMNRESEDTMLKIADYNNNEKMVFSRRSFWIFVSGLIAYSIYMIIDIMGWQDIEVFTDIGDCMLGIVLGVLLTGTLFSSRNYVKIKAMKKRLLYRRG